LIFLLVCTIGANALPTNITEEPTSFVIPSNLTVPINTCNLPIEVGYGNDSISSFYFDSNVGVCEPFNYKGAGGNANRFESKGECLAACALDPCKKVTVNGTQIGAFKINGTMQECSYDTKKQDNCPSGYYCSMHENTCCPEEILDVCSLPKAEGIKLYPYSEQRRFYHFDQATGKCDAFFYYGAYGNSNRFVNKSDCEMACIKPVCKMSRPYSKANGPINCSIDGEDCPVGFQCIVGQLNVTSCCLKPKPFVFDKNSKFVCDRTSKSCGRS